MENERQNGDGFDDEFDDFGGFEAADPVDPNTAGGNAGVAVGPNPWAVMYPPAAGARNVQPDLLCGQNRFPQHLDNPLTVDVAGSAEASVPALQVDLGQEGGATGFDPDLDFSNGDGDSEFDLDNVTLANDILDGSFRSTGSNQPNASIVNHGPEQLPDISGLDLAHGTSPNSINRPELVNNISSAIISNSSNEESHEVPSDSVSDRPSVDNSDSSSNAIVHGANAEVVNQSVAQEVNVADALQGACGGEERVSEAEIALQSIKEEKEILKKRLDQMELENTKFSEDLARSQELADSARHKYDELQREHERQLEELRQAGHQSLTVVVSEYRELMAAVAQEQQVACERRFVERMKEEADKFRQILQLQKEEFEQMQVEARKTQEEQISIALQEMRQKEQEQFDKQLAEERKRNEELLQTEIMKERDISAKAIEKVIEEERRKAQQLLEEEQENFRRQLAREVEKSREEIRSILKEQKDKNQSDLSSMLEEERTRSRESLQQTVQSTREDLHKYLQEQRQSEKVVQRRHMRSLDLFLESARQQLKLLMDPDTETTDTDRNTDNTS